MADQIYLTAFDTRQVYLGFDAGGQMATMDFVMRAGDSKSLIVTVKDANTGAVVNLTSATITWKVGLTLKRTTTALTKIVAAGQIALTSPTLGIFTITLAASDTASLEGDYVHEAKITFADATINRSLRGIMSVGPSLNA